MSKRILFVLLILFSHSAVGQRLELPRIGRNEIIVTHTGHTLSFNRDWMQPEWVAYELIHSELSGSAVRKKSSFLLDPSIPAEWQPNPRDYSRTGYSRGHLVPAGDLKYSQRAMDESFFMSNICPMYTEFNTGIWERLERKVRDWAKKYGRVFVICGPIMGDNVNGVVGNSRLLVPDAFFKAVLIPYGDRYLTIAFYMLNSTDPKRELREYAITTRDLEKLLGRKLFSGLNRRTAKTIKVMLPLHELGL